MPPSPLQPWQWGLVAFGITAVVIAFAILIAYSTMSSRRWPLHIHLAYQHNGIKEEEKTIESGGLGDGSFFTFPIAPSPAIQSTETIEQEGMIWLLAPPLQPPPLQGKLPRIFKLSSSSSGSKYHNPGSTRREGAAVGVTKSWRGPTPPWTMSSSFRQHHTNNNNNAIQPENAQQESY